MTKHREMFLRRAQNGQCFHRAYLGCREFAANFSLIPISQPIPEPVEKLPELGFGTPRETGYMLFDVFHDNSEDIGGKHFCGDKCRAHFFKAVLEEGHPKVPSLDEVQP